MLHNNRRQFLVQGSLAAAAACLSPFPATARQLAQPSPAPISAAERLSRIEKAQRLMRAKGMSALLVEPGASLIYFTGIRWWRSERLTAAIIPAEGKVGIVTPFFEEPSIRESLGIPAEVRVWQEDEDPMALAANFLRERNQASGSIGIEESVRFFASDGLRRALPDAPVVPGADIVRACRMIKSPAELALMQKAADIVVAAYRDVYRQVARGMTGGDISRMMTKAMADHGGSPEFALVLLNEASAYPHGSDQPQEVREGSVVLMDCGCTYEGYQADISRTFVVGEPSAEQRKVWEQVRRGQSIAFDAAQVGRSAGSVDDAVRGWYESQGYGPRYALPGLSHRTGHGIGLEGHEPVNLVHGETTPLQPGMCFSNEPGLYFPGKFGVRIEDCFYMTANGPRWFSVPPTSIDDPIG